MATQNQNPSAVMNSKSSAVNQGAPVDGHSVTKRLRNELMSLMVRIEIYTNTLRTLIIGNTVQIEVCL
jgi:hypothetical protein